jgi:opacity protein-like surface antigen
MKRYRRMLGVAGLGLLVLLLAAGVLSAQTKIRVKDPNAVIRIEPADKGEIVQDKLAVGTVYTVERKTGDWYEIKYRSAIGVLLSGFIHQSQVEEVAAEAPVQKTEPEPVQKAAVREEIAAPELGPGLELSLFGGLGMPQVKGTANYHDQWSGILYSVTENADISSQSKSSAFFGAGLNYFFSANIGIGLNVGYLKSGLTTTSAFTFAYSTVSKSASWTGTDNSFTSIPVSLDLIARFGGSKLQGYVQAGPTIFMNDAKIDSAIGWGFNYLIYSAPYYYEFYDAVQIPMNAYDLKGGAGKTSWTGIGGNIGAGATFMLSPSFGLNIEARYFICPEREFDWTLVPGTYKGLFVTSYQATVTVDSNVIDPIFSGNHLTTIKINPSFFQITAGLKIKL